MPGAAQSDATPPSVPTGLVGKAVSSTQIDLSWNPSTDDVGVTGYFIYLNDAAQPLAQTTGTSFQHTGLIAGTTYNYRVSSFDAASNKSAWTGPRLSVSTPPPATRLEEGSVTFGGPAGAWVGRGPDVAAFSDGAALTSDVSGATATFTFTGAAVTWIGFKCSMCGIATVSIDGGPATQVDTAGPVAPGSTGLASEPVFTASGLADGTHTLVITVTGTSNSGGAHIAVDAFDGVTQPAGLTTFSSTIEEFPNPERGLSRMVTENLTEVFDEGLAAHHDAGYRLVAHRQLLPDTETLSQAFLDELNAGAALHRARGTKMAMQFSYDNDESDGVVRPSLATILGHIAQLKPFFTANADVIAVVHAGFLGVFGEWASWTSDLTNPTVPTTEEKNAVRDALYATVDPSTQIAFRNLADLEEWYPVRLNALQAFTGSNQARSGVHNDCFLSDRNDLGTYWKGDGAQDYDRTFKDNRFRAYHAGMSAWTTTGGENCSNADEPELKRCPAVLNDGPLYHWRYLRDDHGVHVQSWKDDGCFPEVKGSLGYRFQLDAISHPTNAAPGNSVDFAVDLRNVGWSRIFSPRKLVVTLKNTATGDLLTGSAGDMRFLPSQATTSTRIVVPVSVPSAGAYDVYLSMPDVWPRTKDNPDFAVRFANAEDPAAGQGWDAANFRFKTGTTLTVQ